MLLATGVADSAVRPGVVTPVPGELTLDRSPPAAGHPRIAGVGAAEHPDADREVALTHQRQALVEARAPGLLESLPVLRGASEQPRARLGIGRLAELARRSAQVHVDL